MRHVMFHVLTFLSLFVMNSAADDGWTAVTRDEKIDYDLETTPLEIKTDSAIGSGDKLNVQYYSKTNMWAAGYSIFFGTKIQYRFAYCQYLSTRKDFNSNFDTISTTKRVWKVIIDRSSGVTVIIYCNDVEVARVTLTDSYCSGRNNWKTHWGAKATKLTFDKDDTASDFYKAPPPTQCLQPKLSDTVSIDVDFSTGKSPGTKIKFTCKPGFGTGQGLTEFADAVPCTVGNTDYTTGADAKVCFQCATPSLDSSKNADYSAKTLLPTKSVDYRCKDGYSFDTVKTDAKVRNTKKINCAYTSLPAPGAANLDDLDQPQCLEDCRLTLLTGHGLQFTLNKLPTTEESVPQDMEYEMTCKDPTKSLPFGQKNLAKCDKVTDPTGSPAEITLKGCHDPCSVAKLKETYNVEWKTTADPANFVSLSGNEVPKDTPLKLASCVGDKVFKSDEKTKNEITCSDSYYDFTAKKFKNIIGCYDAPVKDDDKNKLSFANSLKVNAALLVVLTAALLI